MSSPHYGINAIVFGSSKVGKSWLGDTTPAPRLVLDAEAGSRFTPSRKKIWDPELENPPVVDGTWDTAIVTVRSFKQVEKVFKWLDSGHHPFRSVVLDSISEIQQRIMDDIAGINQPTQQEWGKLLRVGSDLVRKFRDLVVHRTNPLDAVIFIAMARDVNGTIKPFMQGALATTLPYYVDMCAYLAMVPQESGIPLRRLFCGTFPGFETGARLGDRVPSYIDDPDISRILANVRGESSPLPTTSSSPSLDTAIVPVVEEEGRIR